MARLRKPVPRIEVGVPVELLDPFLPLWADDDAVQEWRMANGLPARRWPAPLWRHRRRHGSALDDWAVQRDVVDADGHPDWRRLGPLLRGERNGRFQ